VTATILIAAPEHLPMLKAREDLGETIAFADADVLQALEAITSLRPPVVALEQTFAQTSRGAALINRIKADPTLSSCDIRFVSHEGDLEIPPVPAATEANLAHSSTLPSVDFQGTRKAERFRIVDGVEVQIEGSSAQLVDLSTAGAQVVSPTILKPNQRVRLSLAAASGMTRLKGLVSWASFELPQGTPRYRAGIEFFGVHDPASIVSFIESNKR